MLSTLNKETRQPTDVKRRELGCIRLADVGRKRTPALFMYNILTTTTMETTKMCLLELTKAEAMVLANVIRRTANENPFHWKESSVEKTRDLYDSVIAQLYDYKY